MKRLLLALILLSLYSCNAKLNRIEVQKGEQSIEDKIFKDEVKDEAREAVTIEKIPTSSLYSTQSSEIDFTDRMITTPLNFRKTLEQDINQKHFSECLEEDGFEADLETDLIMAFVNEETPNNFTHLNTEIKDCNFIINTMKFEENLLIGLEETVLGDFEASVEEKLRALTILGFQDTLDLEAIKLNFEEDVIEKRDVVEVEFLENKSLEVKSLETDLLEIELNFEEEMVEKRDVVEVKALENKFLEVKPLERELLEIEPNFEENMVEKRDVVEIKSLEVKPLETKLLEVKTLETEEIVTEAVETEAVETEAVETEENLNK